MPRAAVAPVAAPINQQRSAFPGFIEPNLATLRDRPPSSGDWIHEVKFDGYRAQAHIRDGEIRILTRRGYDWTDQFRNVAQALSELAPREAILDGEIIVPDDRGVADFHKLRNALRSHFFGTSALAVRYPLALENTEVTHAEHR